MYLNELFNHLKIAHLTRSSVSPDAADECVVTDLLQVLRGRVVDAAELPGPTSEAVYWWKNKLLQLQQSDRPASIMPALLTCDIYGIVI